MNEQEDSQLNQIRTLVAPGISDQFAKRQWADITQRVPQYLLNAKLINCVSHSQKTQVHNYKLLIYNALIKLPCSLYFFCFMTHFKIYTKYGLLINRR